MCRGNAAGAVVTATRQSREVLDNFANCPSCLVESKHVLQRMTGGRELQGLGHTVY